MSLTVTVAGEKKIKNKNLPLERTRGTIKKAQEKPSIFLDSARSDYMYHYIIFIVSTSRSFAPIANFLCNFISFRGQSGESSNQCNYFIPRSHKPDVSFGATGSGLEKVST